MNGCPVLVVSKKGSAYCGEPITYAFVFLSQTIAACEVHARYYQVQPCWTEITRQGVLAL